MKVILSAAALAAFCLSSISAQAQAVPSTTAHDPGRAETNKTTAHPQLQRIRRRLSERNVDLLMLLQQNESKLNSPESLRGGSTFTVQDGLYQLVGAPEAPSAVQFSASGVDAADSNPTSKRTRIHFSYPSTLRSASEASASLASAGSPEAASMMAPLDSDPAGVPASEGVLAWSDGVSKTSASLDGSLPAEADLRSAPKPNIIIPEPKEWVLFAIFGGAILTFSSRRRPAKPAA